MTRRRYIVLGAGGVGSALGGMLQRAGAKVAFVARGAQLDALRRGGLWLDTPSGSSRIDVEAASRPADLGVDARDIVLLCTKSQDAEAALEGLAAAAPRDVPIVCAQNGVATESTAATRFDRVYGMVVFAPVAFTEPGRVALHAAPTHGGLDIGRHPAGVDDLANDIARDLSQAGFDARAEPRVRRMKYGKLLSNLGNAVEALAGRAELGGSLLERLLEEATACYRAAGIDHMPLDELYNRFAGVRALPVRGAARGGGSSWQSLARGTGRIETDFLNGEIVRLGERHGVATPANRAITALALRAAAEGWPPERLSATELEREISGMVS